MCPEKERYMRDVKKSLHFYECHSDGRMVHEKMIKDYSRSAADQVTNYLYNFWKELKEYSSLN